MSRITQKGQVTIPKEIREKFGIKPNDIGEFTIKEGNVIFTVKRGTILDAHRKRTGKGYDIQKIRELMEKDSAQSIVKEIK
ncbi:MAG: AbrB/MazE/SpoVT family DNA-binding domain-containing protein [Actinobacteria bacterium]|jgi:AbrB family looped-hinge helix DNA binding protein|nr:AbrB/MazE/SpoVT family DNA-binding domain-containing protein [Actinomycetota bacterium]